LYYEAIRLGFEPAPESLSIVPGRARLEFSLFEQGSTVSNIDLIDPGVLGSSILFYGPQLASLGVNDDPPLITISCHSPQVPISPKSLALTTEVMNGPGVLLLFRLMVFPAGITQGSRLVPVLTYQLFAGAITELQLGRSQYMSEAKISTQNVIEATMFLAKFTDSHPMPSMCLATVDLAPEV
jgi:hypothetical protein